MVVKTIQDILQIPFWQGKHFWILPLFLFGHCMVTFFFETAYPKTKLFNFTFFLIGPWNTLIISLNNKKKVWENLKVLQCDLVKKVIVRYPGLSLIAGQAKPKQKVASSNSNLNVVQSILRSFSEMKSIVRMHESGLIQLIHHNTTFFFVWM